MSSAWPGKEAANGLHRAGLPFVVVALFWLVVLAVILVVWRASGETMSPGSVCTRRQELFYFAAVGSGFALGQSVGHASAEFGFTYLRGELVVVAALTAIVAVAWWRFGLNPGPGVLAGIRADLSAGRRGRQLDGGRAQRWRARAGPLASQPLPPDRSRRSRRIYGSNQSGDVAGRSVDWRPIVLSCR